MKRTDGRLRIIVLGYIVRGPLGGMVWHHLQYVLGLARLGHDVYFFEDSDDYPSCYDPSRHVTDADPAYGLAFAKEIFDLVGLGERWAYHDAHSGVWIGPVSAGAPAICASADLLLNVSGINPMRAWYESIPVRAFIDTDPVFTQIRNLVDPSRANLCSAHTHFLTYGERIADGSSRCPDDGLPWHGTRQPVVPDLWRSGEPPEDAPFSTVMQWDSYPGVEYDGVSYGMKSSSFDPFLDLPRRSDERFSVALGSPSAPVAVLEEHGWEVIDSLLVTRTPQSFQDFIRSSRAEFSVAKHGYVAGWSGWFSERSTSYLAMGRPVLVQDTGFSAFVPVGAGLFTFSSLEEALDGIAAIASTYTAHCAAARELVHAYFHADIILTDLLTKIS